MAKSMQTMREEIYHNYNVDVEDMDADKLDSLIHDLQELSRERTFYEEHLNKMKADMIGAINEIADKWKNTFDAIYLFGTNIINMDDTDVDADEIV